MQENFVIIGAGLVGLLAAIKLTSHFDGVSVVVYEKRLKNHLSGGKARSINLAISHRGLRALREVGLEDSVIEHAVPMYGRMVHLGIGIHQRQPYGLPGQCIYSISRQKLHSILLEKVECNKNIIIYWGHSLEHIDGNQLTYMKGNQKILVTISPLSILLACDGANSRCRKLLNIPYAENEILLSYKELQFIPGSLESDLHHLHIWPGLSAKCMLIALPNCAKENDNDIRPFTCTFFYDSSIGCKEAVDRFLLPLHRDLFLLSFDDHLVKNPASQLQSINCHRYFNPSNGTSVRVVLLGDAAHAMLPFYGQGMNAGFEDVRLLVETLTNFLTMMSLEQALNRYSMIRVPAGQAICKMAMANYWNMCRSKGPLIIYQIMYKLHCILPRVIFTEYSLVTFTDTPYNSIRFVLCRQKIAIIITITIILLLIYFLIKYFIN